MWDKPKKVKTKQEWADDYGFDGGPTGGYQSNMSDDDKVAWKAKITGIKLGFPQVEIRKTFSRGSQVVIIVNLGSGYNYKYYRGTNPDLAQFATVDEYILHQAKESMARYPGNYKTLQDAIKFQSNYYDEERFDQMKNPTKGINVHLATNGPIQMTFEEMGQMQLAVEEAKAALAELVTK
jgi:hypothetical protein